MDIQNPIQTFVAADGSHVNNNAVGNLQDG